jgi:hypothetical protein
VRLAAQFLAQPWVVPSALPWVQPWEALPELPLDTRPVNRSIRPLLLLARNLCSDSEAAYQHELERQRGNFMKWMGMYLLGYVLLLVAVLLALWKTGVLASIQPFWIGVGLLVAVGLGIMVAVANSGKKETIEVDRN